MTRRDLIQGDLQEQVMRAMWRLERGTVEAVREALPSEHRGAYNTVQTILNRLLQRGLLTRERQGKAFYYAPVVSEADYISGSLSQTLSSASEEARKIALAHLVGTIDPAEMNEISALGAEIGRRRDTPDR